MAKIRFKIVAVVLMGIRVFQEMCSDYGVARTRCTAVMRGVCQFKSVGAVGRAIVCVAGGSMVITQIRRCRLRLGLVSDSRCMRVVVSSLSRKKDV